MNFIYFSVVVCAALCVAMAQDDNQIVVKKCDDSSYDLVTDQVKFDSAYCENCRFQNPCIILFQEDIVKVVWHVTTDGETEIKELTSTCDFTLESGDPISIQGNQTIAGEDKLREKDPSGNIPKSTRIEVFTTCSVKDQSIDEDKIDGTLKISLSVSGGDKKWCIEAPVTVEQGNPLLGPENDDFVFKTPESQEAE